ncbi:LysE family translocator [Pantoea piersonii]|jgi:threonine efflux protein|uniref:LysE family translocator n=1 Tax=Pantoea piersonii TaxID=2364647 RepID=UPI000EA31D27|nr:LysE family translocator [Pantoea piersonii]MBZ6387472.1 LysE family translocator [Pantoea piersonii]MBZ6400740.1 LysE family translocator [Pantoea piersonii]MBZ6408896.1 LysE family translocator [Pantoea piersonii]MBZ6427079.1 LysE family translocator [Pantoea piersonii]NYB04366.1 LysE family translocator [Pantoea piersonii]
MTLSHELILIYTTYFVATASPGPSNMAIMGTAMKKGRGAALALAGGVISGSMMWALLAACGVLTVLATFAQLLIVLKIGGGLYLLWLAFKAGKSALARSDSSMVTTSDKSVAYGKLFRQGILMHIGNPKAILTWVAIMSVALKPGAAASTLPTIIFGCATICVLVFCGYALLFSTAVMSAFYRRIRRGLDALLACCFTIAGLKLVFSRS